MFLSGNRHSILQESLLLVLPAEGKKIRRFSNARDGQCPNSNTASIQNAVFPRSFPETGRHTLNWITAQIKALDAFRGQTVDD
jgi:hypothetical protein